MKHTTKWLIDAYAKYTEWVAAREDNWETFAWEALIIRSLLEERFSTLDSSERTSIAEIDRRLRTCTEQLRELLPAGGDHPRDQWWWYLHESSIAQRDIAPAAR